MNALGRGVVERDRIHARLAEPPYQLVVALLVQGAACARLAAGQPYGSRRAGLDVDDGDQHAGDVGEAALPGRILDHDGHDVAREAADPHPRAGAESRR